MTAPTVEETYPQPVAVETAALDKQLAKLDKKTYTPEYLALINVNDKRVAVRQFAEIKEAKKLTPGLSEEEDQAAKDGAAAYVLNPVEVTDEETGETSVVSATPPPTVASSGDYIANPIEVENEDGDLVVVSATDDPELAAEKKEEEAAAAEEADTKEDTDDYYSDTTTTEVDG